MEQQRKQEDVMEVPEIDGELLVELLDASLAAEEGAGHDKHHDQLGFAADVVVDGWDSQELNSIHPHQEGCEDCGLDDILYDFEGCGCSPAPYAVNDVPVEYWTEEMEAATVGPFTGECMGEWYMDGMLMQWNDGRSYYSFYPASYGGEACMEQLYSSPLWE